MSKRLIYAEDVIDALIERDPNCGIDSAEVIKSLPSAQPETCAYWDRESNFCALHRPSAQPQDIAQDIATIIENERDMRVIAKNAQPDYLEVLGWLMAYSIKSLDLHGRYLPHEVISWLINDFAKEFIAERRAEE